MTQCATSKHETSKSHAAPRTFTRTYTFNATPEHVYNALTRNEEIPTWFADAATFEAKANGKVEWRWGIGPSETYNSFATVSELTPNKRIVLKAEEKSCWPKSTLSFDLRAEGNLTQLTFTHEGLDPEQINLIGQRWTQKLDALRNYVETGRVQIATWTPAQIQERTFTNKMSMLGNVMGFVSEKLGDKGKQELMGRMVKGQAENYKRQGLQSPLHFANLLAQELQNLYGEPVQVYGNANKAYVERHTQVLFNHKAEMGCAVGEYKDYVQNCSQYAQSLIKEVGFHGEVQTTDYGYRLIINR